VWPRGGLRAAGALRPSEPVFGWMWVCVFLGGGGGGLSGWDLHIVD